MNKHDKRSRELIEADEQRNREMAEMLKGIIPDRVPPLALALLGQERRKQRGHVVHVRAAHEHPDGIYIGRRARQWPMSKWGNPFHVQDHGREQALWQYEDWLVGRLEHGLMRELPELRGRVLICWCAPQPCHGDVLIKLLERYSDDELRSWDAARARAHWPGERS